MEFSWLTIVFMFYNFDGINFVNGIYTNFWHEGNDVYTSDSMTEYRIHSQTLTWYQAQDYCRKNGGDLAKIDTNELLDVLNRTSMEKYGIPMDFSDRVYMSSIRLSEEGVMWTTDCSEVNGTTHWFKNQYSSTKECMTWHYDHIHSSSCNKDERFICEVKTDRPCNMVGLYEAVYHTNGSGCDASCGADVACLFSVTFPADMCVKIVYEGFGTSGMTFSSKLCVDVVYVNMSIDTSTLDPSVDGDYGCPNGTVGTPVTFPPPPNVLPTFPTTTIASTTTCPSITTICPNVTSPVTTTSSALTTSTAAPTTSSLTTSTATTTSSEDFTYQFTVNDLDESAVDIRLTSKYRRSLTCAVDNRPVSLAVGYSSAMLIFIPFALILLSDLATLYKHFRNHETLYNIKKNIKNETSNNDTIVAEGFHPA